MPTTQSLSPAQEAETIPPRKAGALRLWLSCVAFLIAAMILVGGATRLTDSGLSITEWQPIIGAIPPLSDADWQEAFDSYKKIPEYSLVNQGMDLEGFKSIYWWEWAHRFLGRFIGIVFFVPFVGFWLAKLYSEKSISASARPVRARRPSRYASTGTWSEAVWWTGWMSANTG